MEGNRDEVNVLGSYVAQAILKLEAILLSHLPGCWEYSCATSHLALKNVIVLLKPGLYKIDNLKHTYMWGGLRQG